MFFLVTCTMMHSSTDIIDPRSDQDYQNRKVRFNTINDYHDSVPLAQFNQFYSRVVQVLQVCILVTCFTGLACSEPVAPLVIIVIVSLANAIVPFLYSEPVCSVKIVPWLRALGSVLVCWTAIVCALHTRIDAYSWATASALYIGWLVIGLVGLAVVYFMYKHHQANEIQAVNESGLREAINALLGVTGMLTVGDALSGPTVDEASTWRRGKAIEQRIRGAGSLAELCDLVLDLEYAILIERLSNDFLHQRQSWITKLQIAKETPQETQIILKSAISFLIRGIVSTSMVSYVSRNVLTLALRRKCPEEIAWHIFSYLFDATEIEKFVRSLLSHNFDSTGTSAELILSRKREGGYSFLSSFYYNDYYWNRITRDKALHTKPQYDDSTFGGNNYTPPAPVLESAESREIAKVSIERAPNNYYSYQGDYSYNQNQNQRQIDSDHALALKLSQEWGTS
jgi:hypothetical protein